MNNYIGSLFNNQHGEYGRHARFVTHHSDIHDSRPWILLDPRAEMVRHREQSEPIIITGNTHRKES